MSMNETEILLTFKMEDQISFRQKRLYFYSLKGGLETHPDTEGPVGEAVVFKT